MVAQVAADDPDTAAKIVQPMMLVCSSLPGTRASHGASPLNMSSDKRVRNRISPIQTKSGSAVSVHDDAVPQIVTAIASPAGRDEKSSMPIHATPASDKPIHTPLPSRTNRATTSKVVMKRSISGLVVRFHAPPLAGNLAHELVDEGDGEHHRAHCHRELRQPERRGVVPGRDVVQHVGLPRQAYAEIREHDRQHSRRAERPALERSPGPRADMLED